MKKQFLSLFLMAAAIMPMQAIQKEEVKPVKNVIVMISLVAMVSGSLKTQIEHRPLSVWHRAHPFV